MSRHFSTSDHTPRLSRQASAYPLAPRFAETGPLNLSLVTSLKLGDERAVAYLFSQHSALVYSVALSILRDDSDAQDIVQEVFMQVWKTATTFVSERGSVQEWLTMIARSRSIDALRKRRSTDAIEDVRLTSQQNFSHDVERNILAERVKRLAAALPAKQRKGMQMAFFEEMSHSEIARRISSPLGTVKTTIRSGVHSVREAIAVAHPVNIAPRGA
jgi:RNA polymerase sigma-70 factor (ECF subfamily)